MWAFDGIKVGNTFTTGGHLVVFRWAFGGIQVGKTWGLFSEMGNTTGPPSKYHVGPSYRQ